MKLTNSQKKVLAKIKASEIEDVVKKYDDGGILVRKFLSKIGYIIGIRGGTRTIFYKDNSSSKIIKIT